MEVFCECCDRETPVQRIGFVCRDFYVMCIPCGSVYSVNVDDMEQRDILFMLDEIPAEHMYT
jgi:hypothetical protein